MIETTILLILLCFGIMVSGFGMMVSVVNGMQTKRPVGKLFWAMVAILCTLMLVWITLESTESIEDDGKCVIIQSGVMSNITEMKAMTMLENDSPGLGDPMWVRWAKLEAMREEMT